jgi:nitrile hydratase
MAHDHPHDHPHDHDGNPARPDDPEPQTYHELLGVALSDLLIDKGVYTKDDERRRIEFMEGITPAIGAKVVARAWCDPDFARRLVDDAASAMKEMDVLHTGSELTALVNTPYLHNVVVCTLCSCYPRYLLGRPPAWYKSKPYRARVVREPRAVLAEFGTDIDTTREVRVHDSTAELRYLVIPMRPDGTDDWTEEQLAEIVTRDSMIGVAEVSAPEVA